MFPLCGLTEPRDPWPECLADDLTNTARPGSPKFNRCQPRRQPWAHSRRVLRICLGDALTMRKRMSRDWMAGLAPPQCPGELSLLVLFFQSSHRVIVSLGTCPSPVLVSFVNVVLTMQSICSSRRALEILLTSQRLNYLCMSIPSVPSAASRHAFPRFHPRETCISCFRIFRPFQRTSPLRV